MKIARILGAALAALFCLAGGSPLSPGPGPAWAVDANTCGYAQGNGGWYKLSDRSGPYSLDGNCNASLQGSSTGSSELDVTESRTLNAASTTSQQTYALNGQSTFSFNFSGLAASGATVSFFQSNDWNGSTGTFTAVSEVNTGTGAASLTRSVDGQSAIGVEGSKALRVQVTTAGTGTITLASNISIRSRYAAIRSPVPGLATTSVAISPQPAVARAAASLVAKTAAANVYGFSFTQGGTAGFLALLDAAAAPAAGAAIAPVECIPVAASSGIRSRHDIPDRYAAGVVALSTSSCTTYTAVTPVLMSVSAQ